MARDDGDDDEGYEKGTKEEAIRRRQETGSFYDPPEWYSDASNFIITKFGEFEQYSWAQFLDENPASTDADIVAQPFNVRRQRQIGLFIKLREKRIMDIYRENRNTVRDPEQMKENVKKLREQRKAEQEAKEETDSLYGDDDKKESDDKGGAFVGGAPNIGAHTWSGSGGWTHSVATGATSLFGPIGALSGGASAIASTVGANVGKAFKGGGIKRRKTKGKKIKDFRVPKNARHTVMKHYLSKATPTSLGGHIKTKKITYKGRYGEMLKILTQIGKQVIKDGYVKKDGNLSDKLMKLKLNKKIRPKAKQYHYHKKKGGVMTRRGGMFRRLAPALYRHGWGQTGSDAYPPVYGEKGYVEPPMTKIKVYPYDKLSGLDDLDIDYSDPELYRASDGQYEITWEDQQKVVYKDYDFMEEEPLLSIEGEEILPELDMSEEYLGEFNMADIENDILEDTAMLQIGQGLNYSQKLGRVFGAYQKDDGQGGTYTDWGTMAWDATDIAVDFGVPELAPAYYGAKLVIAILQGMSPNGPGFSIDTPESTRQHFSTVTEIGNDGWDTSYIEAKQSKNIETFDEACMLYGLCD